MKQKLRDGRLLLQLRCRLAVLLLAACWIPVFAESVAYQSVVPGYAIVLPRDEGSHPQFRTEWWYVTGWLETESGAPLGFQVTFFRRRPGTQEDNPSRFAARQVLFAHAALSDPRAGRLLRGERAARAGFDLARAHEGALDVAIDDWFLRRDPQGSYRTTVVADDFAIDLSLMANQPPLLHGKAGYSQKSPDVLNASYYYSLPQLQVTGQVTIGKQAYQVRGLAWMDHEWSTTFIDAQTQGWDWMGVNLDDGGAIMASRMRNADAGQRWAFATRRSGSDGVIETFPPEEIEWRELRRWRSPRTGVEYPVEWQVRTGGRTLRLRPLMDDQESDARESTGTLYWEGAVYAYRRTEPGCGSRLSGIDGLR